MAMNSKAERLQQGLTPSQRLMLEQSDFSLVLGGPLYQLFRRSHLSGDAFELAVRRIVFISLLAWLPLLVLSAVAGELWSSDVAVPFLMDVEVHVRFLVAMPLLIVAELVVHRRMRLVVRQFLDRQLIPEDAKLRFDAAIAAVWRLRNSTLGELTLVALVYGVGILVIWRLYAVLDKTAWYTVPTVAGTRLSLAGMWYTFLSVPLFQFMLLRWYFRLFIWARFLWQVSRIDMSLVPTHPDRLGGLGFLAGTAYAFIPLAVAHGAVLSGMIANRILHLGTPLTAFKVEIGVVVAFVLLLVFGPLLLFAPQLARAKRDGNREYGTLAERYVREFDTKWLRGGAPPAEGLVGSADIQSLADLSNSFEVVRSMRIALVTRDAVIQLAVATLLPLAPLLLTLMPLEELLKQLFGILF
ncbi:MAG TPA: hypothetical protein VH041_10365 [Caldimonas sp.]|jgi:hypothetical protein|nr:hypothetical protein [Caldimonas sp.]HEX4234701.1 hypothetical protein [Caldimonas sp.]